MHGDRRVNLPAYYACDAQRGLWGVTLAECGSRRINFRQR
jgi:hypothetical protein